MKCPYCQYLNLSLDGRCEQCGRLLPSSSGQEDDPQANNRGQLRDKISLLGGRSDNTPTKSNWKLPFSMDERSPQERQRQAHNHAQRQKERGDTEKKASIQVRIIGVAIAVVALLVILSLTFGWPFPWN